MSLRGIVYILHTTRLVYECWQTVLCFLAFGVILFGLWGNLFVSLQVRVLFNFFVSLQVRVLFNFFVSLQVRVLFNSP